MNKYLMKFHITIALKQKHAIILGLFTVSSREGRWNLTLSDFCRKFALWSFDSSTFDSLRDDANFFFLVCLVRQALNPFWVEWSNCFTELYFFVRLLENIYSCAVLPLQAFHTDPVYRHPGPPDTPVCEPHQSDRYPTFDVYARPWVWLLSLLCELVGYPSQGSLRLHNQSPGNGGN